VTKLMWCGQSEGAITHTLWCQYAKELLNFRAILASCHQLCWCSIRKMVSSIETKSIKKKSIKTSHS